MDKCEYNPQISSTPKIGRHITCGYLSSTISGFDHIKNKHSLYRGKESMKELCKPLIEHAMNIINFEKTKMSSLRPKELKSYKEADKCYIFDVRFFKRFSYTINYKKNKDHCHYRAKYRGVARSICNLKLSVPNEIPVVFHNDSNMNFI